SKITVSAGVHRLQRRIGILVSGHDDDYCLLIGASNLGDVLQAVAKRMRWRKMQVKQNQIGPLINGSFQRCIAIKALNQIEILFESPAELLLEKLVVVDDESFVTLHSQYVIGSSMLTTV